MRTTRTPEQINADVLQAEGEHRLAKLAMQQSGMKLNRLYLEAIEERYRLAVGALVSTRDGRVYRVTIVRAGPPRERPWLTGQLRKKDGTFSTRENHLYTHWTEVVEEAPDA